MLLDAEARILPPQPASPSPTRQASPSASPSRPRACLFGGKGLRFGSVLGAAISPLRRARAALKPFRQPVKIEVDHGGREKGQRLADQQASHHRIAERLPDLGAG